MIDADEDIEGDLSNEGEEVEPDPDYMGKVSNRSNSKKGSFSEDNIQQ